MNPAPNWTTLRSESEQIRSEFLKTDLEVCFTFVGVTETEIQMGDLAHAKEVLGKAQRGYEVISQFLPSIADEEQRQQIAGRLAELGESIEATRKKLV